MATMACPEISAFQVSLLQPQGIYQAGQLLQGYVTLVLAAPLTLHGLYLRFVGGASAQWMQVIDDENQTSRLAQNSEIYFDKYELLFGKNPSDAADHGLEPVLEANTYSYPFQFWLPRNIPASLETPTGHVRYTIETIVGRPWSSDVKCVITYTVLACIDLRMDRTFGCPVYNEGQVRPGLFVWCQRPIRAWLQTNKKGYVAGESIVLKGKVDNTSSRKVRRCTVSLKMKITYRALIRRGSYTKCWETDLILLKKGAIRSGESQSWDGEQILVPSTTTSSLDLSNIIKVTYVVQMQVYTTKRGAWSEMSIPVTIIIGNTPIHEETRAVLGSS